MDAVTDALALDQGPETDEKTPPQCRACHYDHHNECEDDRCVCK